MAFELAIVGLDCRFPRSRNVDEYWENLRNGVDCVSVLQAGEIASIGLDASYVASPNFVPAAYELEDIEKFDAAFFDIAVAQAMVMSPQHRLILESAWSACEHAGYNPLGFSDDVGVFIASDDNTYYLGLRNNPKVAELGAQKLVTTGNYLAYLPAWVSYKLNLKGPSLGIHAGCCSSLAAVHLACNSLLLGECRTAIAGAVAAKVPQRGYYHYEPGGIESADGRCRPFAAEGTGTVYGNGVATVVIKRLADAVADRDTIHAVIKGSALNNDGGLKVSFSAPDVQSWTSVIMEALIQSDVNVESVGYIEAHGTGTPVGDALEIEAMTKAFRKHTTRKRYCAVGSVKSNIGHLEAAAGMAGLIKTICVLKEGVIPPTVHLRTLNERIDFENSPFFVNSTLIEWPDRGTPRRAAVNSFGIGGGNAHLVLEQAPPVVQQPARMSADQILLLSAKTPDALRMAVDNLLRYLQRHPSLRIEDVAYTLMVGRTPFNHRCAVVCCSVPEAIDELTQIQRRAELSYGDGQRPLQRPVFLMTGIAAGTVELSRQLYGESPTFKHAFDECASSISRLFGADCDFHARLYGPGSVRDRKSGVIGDHLDDLASFAIQYGLARVWISMGIKPVAIVGSGIARYVAAALSETMEIGTALRLTLWAASQAGKGKQRLPSGLDAEGGFLRSEHLRAPKTRFWSEHSEAWITDAEATDSRFWIASARHLVHPDGFGLEQDLQASNHRLVEVGCIPLPEVEPGTVFSGRLLDRSLRLPPLQAGEAGSASRVMLRILTHLWRHAVEIHTEALSERAAGRRIPLPTYAFERKRYWIDEQRDTSHVPIGTRNAQERGADAPEPVTTEDRLLEICRNLLEVPGIRPTENFFDLGGNSLLINRLRIRIREDLGVEVPLQTLFEYPTVRTLSTQVDLISTRNVA